MLSLVDVRNTGYPIRHTLIFGSTVNVESLDKYSDIMCSNLVNVRRIVKGGRDQHQAAAMEKDNKFRLRIVRRCVEVRNFES